MIEAVKHREIKLPDLLKEKYIELDLKEKERTNHKTVSC